MGKSNKKVKSDKINALRKQYDAFVEEDKKRKERNEYILGRLDKMRYCTTLVPVRHKAIPVPDINRPPTTYFGYQPDVSIARDYQPSVVPTSQLISMARDQQPSVVPTNQLLSVKPITNIDDNYLINEISKNYILIPKLKSSFTNNYIHAPLVPNNKVMQGVGEVQQLNNSNNTNINIDSNESNDWKSKYEILNILKNEEKEKQTVEPIDNRTPIAVLNQENLLNSVNDIPNIKSGSQFKYLDDVPEKDTTVEINKLKFNEESKKADTPVLVADSDTTKVLYAEDNSVTEVDYKLQNTNLESNYYDGNEVNLESEDTNYVEQEYYSEHATPQAIENQGNYVEYTEPINDAYPTPEANCAKQNHEVSTNEPLENKDTSAYNAEHFGEYKSEDLKQIEHDNYDLDHVEVTGSSELMEEIKSAPIIPDPEPTDYVQYATENMKVQELTPNVNAELQRTPDVNTEQHLLGTGTHEVSHLNQAYDNEMQQQQQYVASTEQQQPYGDGTQQEQQQYVDGTQQQQSDNIQPQPMSEYIADETDAIEAFETEQKEMFYSEDLAQNYQQGQHPNEIYEQAYQKNVTYDQNQEYPYYENNDEVYNPVDLGENEEQMTRYDQVYQQQYEDPYEKAYEKPNETPEETPQTYDPIGQEDKDQIEQLQYQDYNPEYVENMLDSEDGYIQEKEEVVAKEAINTTQAKVAE